MPSPAPRPDPLRALQLAAVAAAIHLAGVPPERVVIYGRAGRLFEIPVPHDVLALGPPAVPETNAITPGWDVTDRAALFDGVPIAVARSRLPLLRALVNSHEKLSAKELIGIAFDAHTTEGNVRFHVAELRDELQAAFPKFEGDPIPSGGGYLLELR